jgi:hypothetical protein
MKRFRDSDYYVTEDGRVISTKYAKTKELKPRILPKGYHQVDLMINNKRFGFLVSRLVAEVYIPNPNNLPEVDHKDTNKSNNHMLNLEWVTHSENMDRATENGLMKHSNETKLKISISNIGKNSGEKHPKSILTEEQVKWIRDNYISRDKEFGCRAIAKKLNLCPSSISNIITNKNWSQI